MLLLLLCIQVRRVVNQDEHCPLITRSIVSWLSVLTFPFLLLHAGGLLYYRRAVPPRKPVPFMLSLSR